MRLEDLNRDVRVTGIVPGGDCEVLDVRWHGDEILRHVSQLPGAELEITIEIQARFPDGAADDVCRTVEENCRTLKFTSYGFEEE